MRQLSEWLIASIGFACLALVSSAPLIAQVQQAALHAADAAAGDHFGSTVAIDGDTAVIGATSDNFSGAGDAGSAYVFVRSDGVWAQQAKIFADDLALNDGFGKVSVSGDTLVVGSAGDDHSGLQDAGSAYVFIRERVNWTQIAKLTASDAAEGDGLGISTALDGDTAIVGAWLADHAGGANAGAAYVYVHLGGVWTQQAKLTAADAAGSAHFGWSVALAGDTAVIGAKWDGFFGAGTAGSAYVFTRSGDDWSQQAKLVAGDAAAFDEFGTSVSIHGDSVVVGAPHPIVSGCPEGEAGAAYVFVRSAGVWTQQIKLTSSDAACDDEFGTSVAIQGDTAVIGAQWDGGGSAYVFMREGTLWTQQVEMTDADLATDARFGRSVALDDETVIVGAWFDDYAGLNHAGSAHVFVLDADAVNLDDHAAFVACMSGPAGGVAPGCAAVNDDQDDDVDLADFSAFQNAFSGP